MKLQEHTVQVTREAALEVFRYVKAVPADRLKWQPLDTGRSVLEIARELAKTPDWAYDSMFSEWDEAAMAEGTDEMLAWTTPEQCEAACQQKLERFFEAILALPDERLTDTRWLPFGGGRDFTFAEMMDYPRWNFTWHCGQIAYIQMLYGDKDMY